MVVELCERFTYYGLTPPFQNYIQNGPTDDPKGYLALGQRGATGLGNVCNSYVYKLTLVLSILYFTPY